MNAKKTQTTNEANPVATSPTKDEAAFEVECLLRNCQWRLNDKATQLKETCAYMVRRLQETVSQVELFLQDQPFSINGSGVVQGEGGHIDMLCAEFECIRQEYAVMKAITKKLTEAR